MYKSVFIFSIALTFSFAVKAQKYRATLKTRYGKIVLELYNKTPKHQANFVNLCKQHFYDGMLFHRVIPAFMIQGGDPDSKTAKSGQVLGEGDVGYTIPAEFNKEYIHLRGALAAARDNNPAKASSGCQFYIVQGKKFTEEQLKKTEARTGFHYTAEQMKEYETLGGAPHLDGNYTVYGKVLKGMYVVDIIARKERDKNDRPLADQRIQKLRVHKKFLIFWL